MSKYYDKELPVTVNVIYGGRYSGKTYREFEKLKARIEELEEENKRLKFCMKDTYDSANDTCGELQQRIGKAIEYINECTKITAGCGLQPLDEIYAINIIDILRGEENE